VHQEEDKADEDGLRKAAAARLEAERRKPGGLAGMLKAYNDGQSPLDGPQAGQPERARPREPSAATTKRGELLAWAQQSAGPGVAITNLSTSWKNGLAFCAVIHAYHPTLIGPLSKLKDTDAHANLLLAFNAAEVYLDVPKLIDPEDVMDAHVPDEKCIMAYLLQLRPALLSGQLIRPAPASAPDRRMSLPLSSSAVAAVADAAASKAPASATPAPPLVTYSSLGVHRASTEAKPAVTSSSGMGSSSSSSSSSSTAASTGATAAVQASARPASAPLPAAAGAPASVAAAAAAGGGAGARPLSAGAGPAPASAGFNSRVAPARKGWLLKAGKLSSKFKHRLFILQGDMLSYQKSEIGEPAGVIPLATVLAIELGQRLAPGALANPDVSAAEAAGTPSFRVTLETKARSYHLHTWSLADAQGWVDACTAALAASESMRGRAPFALLEISRRFAQPAAEPTAAAAGAGASAGAATAAASVAVVPDPLSGNPSWLAARALADGTALASAKVRAPLVAQAQAGRSARHVPPVPSGSPPHPHPHPHSRPPHLRHTTQLALAADSLARSMLHLGISEEEGVARQTREFQAAAAELSGGLVAKLSRAVQTMTVEMADARRAAMSAWAGRPEGWLSKPDFKKADVLNWLESRGDVKYQKRWFVLSDNLLHYYAGPKSVSVKSQKGCVDLSLATEVRASQAPKAPRFALDIVCGQFVYTVCPESEEDRLKWAIVFARAAQLTDPVKALQRATGVSEVAAQRLL
jgi:hypothetical protein